nr:NADH dehydrogenase subunit 2 [Bombylius sp.]
MFKNSSKILFLTILVLGTMITISSNSWLGSWMGLEINLLAFIPLMSNTNNLMSTESSLKYFLVQALASSILLLAIMILMMKWNFIIQPQIKDMLPNSIMFYSLLLKSGAAPFHFWFPTVMEGLTWMNSLILMTWQKIAPMMLISYIYSPSMMISSIILSVLVGSLGGLNQSSLRKLMAFSSINHIGWMMAGMMFSEELWMMYFIMYSFLSSTLILMFNLFKMFHFNQLFNSFFSSKMLKFTLFMNLLSLGGLPPFLGFLPKWLIIQHLSINNQLVMISFMVILTLITLFFYIRMAFSAFMLNYYENNWFTNSNNNNSIMTIYMISSFMSISGLTIVSMLYFTL